MKKATTLIGAIALASMTSLAFAGGQGCDRNFEGAMQSKTHHFEKSMQHRHGKICDHKGQQGKYFGMRGKNITPEKRQALMQLKVENRLERMTRKLDLTKEQQAEIRSIMQDRQQQMHQLRQQSRDEINKVLTKDQREKKEQFRDSMKGSQRS